MRTWTPKLPGEAFVADLRRQAALDHRAEREARTQPGPVETPTLNLRTDVPGDVLFAWKMAGALAGWSLQDEAAADAAILAAYGEGGHLARSPRDEIADLKSELAEIRAELAQLKKTKK
jgi:hypothetical protein